MTQQTKLYEAAMALIGDLINRRSHFNSFQNLCRVLCEYEQSIEQPEATDCVCGIPTPDADRECCTICGHLIHAEEQPEAIAGENQSALGFIESEYGKTWTNPYFGWSTDDVVDAMSEYASQQTSAKDKEIKELKHESLLNTEINEAINDRINELTKEIDTVKREKLALNLLIDEITDGNCLKQSKAKLSAEIKELKEAISELIQVKDWKDKNGKDEHYLKAMPIAWENVRKLIQK